MTIKLRTSMDESPRFDWPRNVPALISDVFAAHAFAQAIEEAKEIESSHQWGVTPMWLCNWINTRAAAIHAKMLEEGE
jgi:hypothetical protein